MRPANDRAVDRQRGFTLIDLLFVVSLIGLLATLAIPGLMRARGAAHSASALGTIRVVNSAQLSFAISCGLGFYAPGFRELAAKPKGSPEGFLPRDLASGADFVKSGYRFSMAGESLEGTPETCNSLGRDTTAAGYTLIADQLDAEPGRGRFFGTNADGIIFEHAGSLKTHIEETGAPRVGSPVQ